MGPTWVMSVLDGAHVGPMNLAIRDVCHEWTPSINSAYVKQPDSSISEDNFTDLLGHILEVTVWGTDGHAFPSDVCSLTLKFGWPAFSNERRQGLLIYVVTISSLISVGDITFFQEILDHNTFICSVHFANRTRYACHANIVSAPMHPLNWNSAHTQKLFRMIHHKGNPRIQVWVRLKALQSPGISKVFVW